MGQFQATGARRVETIDAVRGLVMIIMALDHVRDCIHRGAMDYSPTDLTRTTPLLFCTRWVTHACAPTFMLLAGLGAFLRWQAHGSKRELSLFLLTRGLWLIVLELTAMQFAYAFDLSLQNPILLLVLWALGLSMIVLAALIWLPFRVLAFLSIAVIASHNLLDGLNADRFGLPAWAWNLIHQPGGFRAGQATIIVGYPLIPWAAVMSLGFCLGPIFLQDRSIRRRDLAVMGAGALLGFMVIRVFNGYGDPAPWTMLPSPTYTVLSFFNATKYPPSLDFLLMTLGLALLALAWFDRTGLKTPHPLIVFGRVPLFYFVVHFYAAHVVTVLLALADYGTAALTFMFQPVPSMGGSAEAFPPHFGYNLWVAYVLWAGLVLGLYPACLWFGAIKAKRRDWWLSYL